MRVFGSLPYLGRRSSKRMWGDFVVSYSVIGRQVYEVRARYANHIAFWSGSMAPYLQNFVTQMHRFLMFIVTISETSIVHRLEG